MKSLPEMLFMQQCASDLAELPEREYVFARPRRWRFDFAWPNTPRTINAPWRGTAWDGAGIAVEIEGGIWIKGAHTRGKHFESDARKYNEATRRGWRVYRFSAGMVESGEAIAFMREVLSPLAERPRRANG